MKSIKMKYRNKYIETRQDREKPIATKNRVKT